MNVNRAIQLILDRWNESVENQFSNQRVNLDTRRRFIKQFLAASLLSSASITEAEAIKQKTNQSNADLWKTLAAVQLHLLPPTDNAPDAHSINAIGYLQSLMQWSGVDPADKKFIKDGVGWLNGIADSLYKKTFVQLNAQQKEKTLRTVEQSQAGENWLSLNLLYLIEALLTDPVYGGNANQLGWKWLQHQPGFPRPPENKRYFLL